MLAAAANQLSPPFIGAHGAFVFRDRAEREGERGVEDRSLAHLVSGRALAIDARAMAAKALVLSPTVPTETPYQDIAAEWREVGGRGQGDAAPPGTAAEAVSVLRRALEDAVDRSLAGTKRVGVLAGGGVDSSAMLALAVGWARRTGGTAFAVALDYQAEGDDRPHLRALEAHLGCEVIRVRPEEAAPRMALVHEGVDGAPFTWCTGPCEVEMLARARAHGAECVLTGVGGDELFDGEPRSLARLAASGRPHRALVSARRMEGFARPRSPALSWVLRPLLVELVPRWLRERRARRGLAEAPAWAGPRLREVLRDQARLLARCSYAPRRDGATRFEEFIRRPHRVHLAWLRHQEEVASGISRRDPYLDLDLVRTVTSLPPEWLLHGARRRGLLRDAMDKDLPAGVRERQDKASFEPALERFTAAAGGLRVLAPYVHAERLAALGIVDARAFAEAAASFLARPASEEWVLVWPALACEAFLRRVEVRP